VKGRVMAEVIEEWVEELRERGGTVADDWEVRLERTVRRVFPGDDRRHCVVDYQPGNGTRYVLLFTWLTPEERQLVGGPVVVSKVEGRTGCSAFGYGMATPDYVAEALDLGQADAVWVAALITRCLE
jgi:hypothetical protein